MDMQCEASAQVEQCDRESQPQFNVCGNRGDAECCPTCPFYTLGGNTFHCQQHLGAVHVCDMRCRFRALDMGPNCDQIQYRCAPCPPPLPPPPHGSRWAAAGRRVLAPGAESQHRGAWWRHGMVEPWYGGAMAWRRHGMVEVWQG